MHHSQIEHVINEVTVAGRKFSFCVMHAVRVYLSVLQNLLFSPNYKFWFLSHQDFF